MAWDATNQLTQHQTWKIKENPHKYGNIMGKYGTIYGRYVVKYPI